MKKIITLSILILSSAPLCYGQFSFFVNITPTQQSQKIKVSVRSDGNESYTVSFPWSIIEGKQCWLIVFKEGKTPQARRDFRDFIWDKEIDKQTVEKIEPLSANKDGFIEIKITAEKMNRSFVIIDFPHMVCDGGCYYTIDLPEFLKEIKK